MVKIYGDTRSCPTRAVLAFCKLGKIPFTYEFVNLATYQQDQPTYKGMLDECGGYVPALDDDGFLLGESCSIMPYLAQRFGLEEEWYPKDLQARGRVDMMLHWQHLKLRFCCSQFSFHTALAKAVGKQPDEQMAIITQKAIPGCLEKVEYALTQTDYIALDQMTLADISFVCELAQLQVTDINFDEYEKLKHWYTEMYNIPEIREVHELLEECSETIRTQRSEQNVEIESVV